MVAQPLDEWIRQAHPDVGEANLQEILHKCVSIGLDPRLGDVHLIKRGRKLTVMVGIDGMRKTAARTGELNGCTAEWCGEDGLFRDVWIPQTPPSAARVRVYRKGCERPFEGVAKWSEYAQSSGLWPTMSALMLSKVSEALALRRGFPDVLGGLYSQEEMDQATGEEPGAPLEAPAPGAGTDDAPDAFAAFCNTLTDTARRGGMSAVIESLQRRAQAEPDCPFVTRLRGAYESRQPPWPALEQAAQEGVQT